MYYISSVDGNAIVYYKEEYAIESGQPYFEVESIPDESEGVLKADVVSKKLWIDPIPTISIEELSQQKYTEISAACQQAIYNGFNAEVETGTEHFSLKDEDQINLQTANEAIKSGAMGYPYHSDGNLCRLFKADEITTLANAAVQHKLYHTTYCNHIMRWIDRVETGDELNQIYYGADLPEDLKKNMEQVMAGVKTTM